MGNDGGSIPKRDDLIKDLKKSDSAETSHEAHLFAWFYCSFSKLPLSEPIVSCGLGRLYNKDVLLEYLLSSKEKGLKDKKYQEKGDATSAQSEESGISHITTLKDVRELKLKANPAYQPYIVLKNKLLHTENQPSKWVCPVTKREMNGHAKFVYLIRCGHVFDDQALVNIKSNECLECGSIFKEDEIIPLNPKQDDLPRLKTRLAMLKAAGLTHTLTSIKPSKKRKHMSLGEDTNQIISNKTHIKAISKESCGEQVNCS
ncbi:hypothetical protein PORY_000318 [Pneumocystis oryctolagi]|uniref:Uncharacterized protein n=1 Tax=Pneumocystis oryctolagi TaxID=42067 RepID=A0ACB7CG01_9ASCO|nr:hypothetical protein PORY_000318 [Pneumocystis oryctolagi]